MQSLARGGSQARQRCRFKLRTSRRRTSQLCPNRMSLTDQILAILDEVLSLNGRSATFGTDTYLRGAVPELDSMAVVSLIAALEDQFGFVVNEDDITSDTFATVGSLVSFVGRQTRT